MCKASILSNIGVMNAESHSHSGEPDFRGEAMYVSNRARDRT